MVRDDVIKLLGWRLGDRTDLAERIAYEMRLVQTNVLEGHEWLPWFLQKNWTGLTEPEVETVPFPKDFLQEIEESHMYLTIPGERPLRLYKRDYDQAKALTTGTGRPEYYAVLGTNFYFFPTPDAKYDLTMAYYGKDADMSAENVETLWLKYASDLVISTVGKELAEKHIQNPEAAAGFANDIVVAWDRLYKKHVGLSEVNMSRTMGGDS